MDSLVLKYCFETFDLWPNTHYCVCQFYHQVHAARYVREFNIPFQINTWTLQLWHPFECFPRTTKGGEEKKK